MLLETGSESHRSLTPQAHKLYIILLGPPGAGKGTQASGLARTMGLAHVATGDIFRYHVAHNTELGQLAKSYMDRGGLVPDDVTIRMVLDRLAEDDASRGAVLDGFPRTLEQARAFEAALKSQGQEIGCAILLRVSTDELVQRLSSRWICKDCQKPFTAPADGSTIQQCASCGGELYQRDDDKPETVARRLDVYTTSTAPLIDYYLARDQLTEVDGHQSIEAVRQQLESIARECLTG